MKVAGIICEYNPFHNGHKYQIDTLKKEYDAIVCVMSGSFVQRGEVAIFDKWTRTKAALSSGVDLVIELPIKNVLSSAEGFATGGVEILESLGIIDAISFGSECGNIDILEKFAKALLFETPEISAKIKDYMELGMSYAKSLSCAYNGVLDEEILSSPNNILAIEYIKALQRINSKIKPVTIMRKGAGYHDTNTVGCFASATGLREKINTGEDISSFSPFDFSSCTKYDTNKLTDIFKYKLITRGSDAFSGISDVEAGLDKRFLKFVDRASLSDIIGHVKTKRYTLTRLSRIAMRVVLGLCDMEYSPEYVRILGFNDTGRGLLSTMKDTCRLPVVNKVADFDSDAILPDILATDITALCANTPVPKGRDFTTSPIIFN